MATWKALNGLLQKGNKKKFRQRLRQLEWTSPSYTIENINSEIKPAKSKKRKLEDNDDHLTQDKYKAMKIASRVSSYGPITYADIERVTTQFR